MQPRKLATTMLSGQKYTQIINEMWQVIIQDEELCPECALELGMYELSESDDYYKVVKEVHDYLYISEVSSKCWDL